MRPSVRLRLLIIALLPMLILTPLLIGLTMQRWIARTDQILAARVASELTVARQYLSHLVEGTEQQIAAIAGSAALRDHLDNPEPFLEANRRRLGLDFLRIAPLNSSKDTATSGLALLGPDALAGLAPDLPVRARIALAQGGTETRGMVVRAARPFPGADGRTALLIGGLLLNRNDAFIDRINRLVYPLSDPPPPRDTVAPFDRGITTLFLDDTRIATTLRTASGPRAIGTRAAPEVRARVLDEGRSWHETALVVDARYVSAYEALIDGTGARIGMLYTGIPEAPYTAARRLTWAVIGATFLAATALTVPLFLGWARGIFRPVETMGNTLARVTAGNPGARSLPPGTPVAEHDELLRLAAHLDGLLDLLQERERELRALNTDLNSRVEARTADLVAANAALETALHQLVLSERLATIGKVTAGIAHEINNPLAVIQGNVEVLRMELGTGTALVETELALIDEQVRRVEALVRQLLQFARPEEFAASTAACDPAAVIAGIRPLVRHLLAANSVVLETVPGATRHAAINPLELQQILVNLAANAVQAMPEGGKLLITSTDAAAPDGRPGVRITVQDTGTGIPPDLLARIFDPFFTTRGRNGTGLGLPVCQTLAHRRGGTLDAESTPGMGSVFSLWLPAASTPP